MEEHWSESSSIERIATIFDFADRYKCIHLASIILLYNTFQTTFITLSAQMALLSITRKIQHKALKSLYIVTKILHFD